MDYLPQVTIEPAHGQMDVPYLDPSSTHFNFAEAAKSGEEKRNDPDQTRRLSAQNEPAAALQHCLYFGLLEIVIKPVLDIRREDFLSSPSSGQTIVSIHRLPSLLKRWRHIRADQQSDQYVLSIAEMEARLSATSTILKSTVAGLPQEYVHTLQDKPVEPLPLIILSIQALIETLWDTRILQDHWPFQQVVENPSRFWIDNPFVDRLLNDAGWLPVEVRQMPKDIRFRYYLSQFSRKRILRLSSREPLDLSHIPKMEKERYSASHLEPHCQCRMLLSKLPTSRDLSDSFSLVSLSGSTGCETLQMHQAFISRDADLPFVAFSHVRADGLGSSTSNSLPTCQISLLQQMSNQLIPTTSQPVPFYLDTLCVPLSGSEKRSALRNLQHVFKLARKVMVLDSALRNTPVGLPQENLTRIRYSFWAKRLWTVQECAVSRDVNFQFLDQKLSLKSLLNSYDQGSEFPLLRIQSLKDRNLPAFGEEDYEDLATSLELLSDDIHMAESLRHATREADRLESCSPTQGCDKDRLRRILRLGLLAIPPMRYFAETTESANFETVTRGLLSAYASYRSNGLRRASTASTNFDELYARLTTVQALGLVPK